MNIKEIRYLNARALVDRAGGVSAFAERIGKGQSQVSQFAGENPIKGIGDKIAGQIEEAFGLPRGYMDRLHGDEGERVDGSPSEEDYALVPQYTACGSLGNGHLNDHVEIKGGLAFKREWLSRLRVNPKSCSVIYAVGDSMAPTIADGVVVLINHAETEPVDGKVYLICRSDGDLIIKRLVRQFSGWLIRSDNDDKRSYPDEPISTDALQHIRIIGRAVWHGGGL
jgi:phage repressor protein C with HTH and peptisase S24 domain